MSIYRINYFSKRKKENSDDEISDKQLGVLAGSGLGYLGSRSVRKHLGNKLERSSNNSEELKNKIIKEAQGLGIEVKSNPELGNSAYTGDSAWKRILGEASKQSKKYKELPDPVKRLVDDSGKDKIHLGSGPLGEADALSHELGHAKLMKSGKSKNLIGRASHKMMVPAKLVGGNKVSILNGFRSGMVAAKREAEGKKDSKLNKQSAWALPAISNGIVVTAEGSASHEGLKSLKKAGANAKYMRKAKGKLGTALGTYVTLGTEAASLGIGSRELGKIVGKQVYKNRRKKDRD